jgi:hypothetical protein
MDSQIVAMECLICQEQFHEDGDIAPFVLICGHSFCRADLNKLSFNGTQNFSCPICQRLVNLDYYDSRFPPKNFSLIEQMKHLTSKCPANAEPEQNQGQESGLCAECNDNTAIIFCQECQVDLCAHCSDLVHKIRILSTHRRIPIQDKPPPQKTFQMCPLHPDEKLKLFCDEKRCRTAICFMCSVYGNHKGHHSERLEVVIAFEKDRLSAALKTCVSEIERLQILSESRSQFVAALLDQEARYLHELRLDVESCLEAVRAKEVEITQALRDKVTELVRGIGNDLAPVTDTRVNTSALCQRAEETNVKAEGAEFVCSAREVTNLLESSAKWSRNISSSLVPFELESLRYSKPLTAAVLSAFSQISNEDLVEEGNTDLIVWTSVLLPSLLTHISSLSLFSRWMGW